MELDPANAEAHNMLGILHPEMKITESLLGDVFLKQGKIEQAREIFQGLAEAFPANILIKDYLGGILLKERSYAEAEKVYIDILELNPGYSRAHEGIGTALMNLGRYDDAEEHYNKVISLSPGSPDPYYNMACLYSRMGNNEESMKWLLKSIERGFQDTEFIKKDPDLKGLREDEFFKRTKL